MSRFSTVLGSANSMLGALAFEAGRRTRHTAPSLQDWTSEGFAEPATHAAPGQRTTDIPLADALPTPVQTDSLAVVSRSPVPRSATAEVVSQPTAAAAHRMELEGSRAISNDERLRETPDHRMTEATGPAAAPATARPLPVAGNEVHQTLPIPAAAAAPAIATAIQRSVTADALPAVKVQQAVANSLRGTAPPPHTPIAAAPVDGEVRLEKALQPLPLPTPAPAGQQAPVMPRHVFPQPAMVLAELAPRIAQPPLPPRNNVRRDAVAPQPPDVTIGTLDIRFEAPPPAPVIRHRSSPAYSSQVVSRLHLRGR